MAIEDAITNDPAIERHGSEAAAKYMSWHWAALSKAVAKGDPTSCVLTESRQSDDRLYGCFRASISEPVERLDLKTPTWRDLLTCMAGRVVDFSFMTLLRPDPLQSYEAQRTELLVVPRAQFVMVELARQREGCYDDRDCCVKAEALYLSRCAERLRRGDNDALAALEAAPLPSKAVPTRRRRSDASMAWADNTRAQVLRLTSASRALAAHARSGSEAAARIVDAWRRHLEPPETEFATRGVVVRRGALETEVLAALTAASSESMAAFEKEVLACVEINQCVGCTAGSVGRRGTGTLTLSSRRRVDGVEDDATVQQRAVKL